MNTIPCPDCGKRVRPCNMARHRKAMHQPRPETTAYGTKLSLPAMPIRQGKAKDRRYDESVPRGEGPYRYRIYRLRAGELELVHAVPSPSQLGIAIVRLHGRGEFVGDDSVGVLDTISDPGVWVINPWTLGRRPVDE